MADRDRWKEEYDMKRVKYDDCSGFGRKDDEADGLAVSRGEKLRHNIARRFNALTDFLE